MTINLIASDLIKQFFKNLHSENLRYAVLRNYELLPEANDSKDVDIVVAPEDIRKVVTVLKEIAQEQGYQLIWKNELDYLEGFVFVKIDDDDIFSIKLDIFNGFKWRGCFYIDHNIILDNATIYNGFKVPLKAHESFIMIVYYILYAKNIRKKYVEPIYANAINNFDDFKTITELTFKKNISERVIEYIQKNEVLSLVKLRKKIRNNIISSNLKNFEYSIRFVNHIKTEYFDRNFFGILFVFANPTSVYKNEIIDTARKIFYSLGITKIERSHQLVTPKILKLTQLKVITEIDLHTNIKKELRDNQIVFFDMQYSDFIVDIEKINNVVEKIFKKLRKPDCTFVILEDKGLVFEQDDKSVEYSTSTNISANCRVLKTNGCIDEDKLMICKNVFDVLEEKYK